MDTTIKSIRAREILDSRGNPTVEALDIPLYNYLGGSTAVLLPVPLPWREGGEIQSTPANRGKPERNSDFRGEKRSCERCFLYEKMREKEWKRFYTIQAV